MKISMRWLKDYVDCVWSAEELAERMTSAGIEVEGIERIGEGLEGVLVGKVVSLRPHPNADKLQVANVDAGDNLLQVVSGAPNLFVGAKVPIAPIGTILPNGMRIDSAEFRGIRSEGMLCSEAELGIGADKSGIMILPEEAEVGRELVDALDLLDQVVEFSIYPNRPDLLSVIGIAREVAALAGTELKLPNSRLQEGPSEAADLVRVEVLDDDLCLRYAARVIEGVKIGPSPAWMQRRLRAAGMRPINNIVDITNFVMLEWGQPLHAFDYDLLEHKAIVVRRARDGEKMITLDGVERDLSSDMLLITDGGNPVAIAGVMGGENTEVGTETRRVLLESANFYGPSIRRTARKLGLRTESSQRFEKGLDPNLAIEAINRAACLMEELAGGVVARGIVDVAAQPVENWTVDLRIERVEEILGISISANIVKSLLARLGLRVMGGDSRITIEVPTYRSDLQREVDLIEEVGRLYGYDKIPVTLPVSRTVKGGRSDTVAKLDSIRDSLVSMGLTEAISYSFVSRKGSDLIRLPEGHPLRQAIDIINPLNEEQSIMRTTLIPGLLDILSRNYSRQVEDAALFELGSVYLPKRLPLNEQPEEKATLGLALMGKRPGPGWKGHDVTFFHLKGIIEALFEHIGTEVEWRSGQHPTFHPGRCAVLLFHGKEVGFAGEIHPEVVDVYDLPRRVYVAEIAIQEFLGKMGRVPKYQRLPRYPSVVRDLALLAPKSVSAEEIEKSIAAAGGDLVWQVRLFDVYEGAQVPEGYRSLAYSITYRAADRTLTDEEVGELIDRIQGVLVNTLGVKLRA